MSAPPAEPQGPVPEFSRPFRLEMLGHATVVERIVASPAERAALAKRLGLVALERLEAELALAWRAGGTVLAVSGRFQASLVQRCVVTLELLPATLDEPLELTFATHRTPPGEEPLDPDAPEPLPPGGLDLGEEVAQALSLALDPYPRKPGASLPDAATAPPEGPFAGLKALKPPRS